MGKRAAGNEQRYGQTSSSKRTTVWAEELHRRQGRSSRTGARAGEKEQQGLGVVLAAIQIAEDPI